MSVSTCGQFVSLLTQSNLLAAEQLLAARRELATVDDEQLPGIVERIVERGWLTGWQARMLLAGHHAFFLGRYKLLDHLGEGGMGSVFKAEQTPLGRTVAIKLISKRRVKDAEAAARFHREIQAAAALSHPHIVAAYDADAVAGRHFLVMEYVEGRDLGAIVKGGKTLPIGEACEYVRQAALGLEHAHQRGMIHRDLKPSNLLVRVQSRESRVQSQNSGSSPSALGSPLIKILDMGLARLDVADAEQQTELTHTGHIVGTPDYISPEQARDSKSADARSDVYSLGCTLFRLISGRVPFEGDGAMAKLMARMSDDPPPLRSVLPDAPPELEAVLLKMMARHPAERYQSATEVIAALTPFARLSETPASIAETTGIAPHLAPTVSFERPPAIDAGLNDFLQNLETAAAREEEAVSTDDLKQTLASGAGAPTAGWSAPVASEQPQASDPGTQQPAHAGRSPQMTRAGKKLQAEIAARNRRERRRLLLIATAVLLLIAAVIGFQQWYQAGEVTLTVDWPRDDLQSVTLTTGHREQRFPSKGQLQYHGRPGTYRLKLRRDGYEPIDVTIQLQRAAVKQYRPRWLPTSATKRQTALADLQRRTDKVLTEFAPRDSPGAGAPDPESLLHDPQIVQLRNDLRAFRRQHSGTEESVDAAKLMARLPWPADRLKREQIDPYELEAAGQRVAGNAPEPLAAIVGDSRLKHWSDVTSLAFSRDGKTLAATLLDGTVHFWNTAKGEKQRQLSGPPMGLYSPIVFGPNGKLLLCGGLDGTVQIWDLDEGTERTKLVGHAAPVRTLALSSDSRFLVSASDKGVIKHWDIAAGRETRSLSVEAPHIAACMVLNANGSRLACSAQDGRIKLWDAATGSLLHDMSRHIDNVGYLAFSPDGKLLATTGDGPASGIISLWDPTSGRRLRTIEGHGRYTLAFSPDSKLLATVTRHRIALLDAITGESRVNLATVVGNSPVAFSPDGKSFAAVTPGNVVKVWDVETGEERIKPDGHQGPVHSITVSPDGTLIASGGADRLIRVWDFQTGNELRRLEGHFYPVLTVAFSPDSRRVLSGAGSTDTAVRLWDVATGQEVRRFTGHTRRVYSVAFSPDGRQALSGGMDGTMRVWDVETGREVRRIDHDRPVNSVAFSPNGRLGLCASKTTRLWNLETGLEQSMGKKGRGFVGEMGAVVSVAFSPDGRTLASGSDDKTIRLWDAATGKQVLTLIGHTSTVRSVAFSPDGAMLASGSPDGTIRLWDVATGSDRHTWQLGPSGSRINQIAFTPDGRHLVTANGNGTVYVLRLKEWSPAKKEGGTVEDESR